MQIINSKCVSNNDYYLKIEHDWLKMKIAISTVAINP